MLHRKKWMPIAIVVLAVQAILEIYALASVARLNMVPSKYMLVVVMVVAMSLFLTAALLFSGMKEHKVGRARQARRIIAIVLAVIFGFGSVMAASMAQELKTSVDKVTDDQTPSAMVGVYVMSDDAAQQIEDAADYNFGIMENYDTDNTSKALDSLKALFGKDAETTSVAGVAECAKALYDGDVDAALINEAYASILSDYDEYSTFSTDTKLLYEIPVYSESDSSEESDNSVQAVTSSSLADLNFDTVESDAAEGVSSVTTEPFVMYISGSDTRSEILDTSRSDVNILMAVNPTTKQVLLINTPRDYYIDNPAGDGAKDKLTHCGIYGVDCSIEALENLYSTDVSYYMQINFTGFEKLIDAIGGITVEIPEDFSAGGYTFTKGQMTLDGAEALVFARERHSFASGDRQRGKDQMEVIRAVIDKVTSGTTVLTHYSDILSSLQDMMVTNMTADEISELVKMQLNDGASWDVEKYAVSGSDARKTTYSMPNSTAYVMIPYEDDVAQATELLQKILSGEEITEEDVSSSS
ncbi:MAG: LCP family protein [Eubacteriales bacterium]|jgi:LCP family protein required for cell wall assembly